MTDYGYIRVSTVSQVENFSLELQADKLRKHGILDENIFQDIHRGPACPQRDELLRRMKPGDTLTVEKLTRVSRSTLKTLKIINELESRTIGFESLDLPQLKEKAIRQMIFSILLHLSEYENEQRKISQREGIELF